MMFWVGGWCAITLLDLATIVAVVRINAHASLEDRPLFACLTIVACAFILVLNGGWAVLEYLAKHVDD